MFPAVNDGPVPGSTRPNKASFTFSASVLKVGIISNISTLNSCYIPISSPEAAILVCARNRDLWARLKARQKDGQISLFISTTISDVRAESNRSRNSWFRFLNRPEPLHFPAAGQTQALGTRLLIFLSCRSKVLQVCLFGGTVPFS